MFKGVESADIVEVTACSAGGQLKLTDSHKCVCVNLCQADTRPSILAEIASTFLGAVNDFHFSLWIATCGFKKCSNHHCVCRKKTPLLSRHKYACRDKSFVAKKLYWSRKNICLAKSILLLRQTRVCRDKTRLLSRPKYACRDKTFVFVATKLLSRQKFYLWHFPPLRSNICFVHFCIASTCCN